MKTIREILLLSLLMVPLVVLTGCGKKTTEEEPPVELTIEPLVGIGPVKFGMSKDEVIEHFGQPDRIFEGKVTKLNYVPSRGLSFVVDAELGMNEIGCWSDGMLPSRITTFSGRTKEGIGIGAAREEIVAAYGQPDRISTGSGVPFESLHYDKLQAKFIINEDRLMSITLNAPK